MRKSRYVLYLKDIKDIVEAMSRIENYTILTVDTQ